MCAELVFAVIVLGIGNDGMLGTRTRGSRMEGANESTELWQHPNTKLLVIVLQLLLVVLKLVLVALEFVLVVDITVVVTEEILELVVMVVVVVVSVLGRRHHS